MCDNETRRHGRGPIVFSTYNPSTHQRVHVGQPMPWILASLENEPGHVVILFPRRPAARSSGRGGRGKRKDGGVGMG